MKAVTFYFWNLEPNQNLHRLFFAFFITYGGSNIWLDLENTGRVTAGKLLATADVQKTSFLQMCR